MNANWSAVRVLTSCCLVVAACAPIQQVGDEYAKKQTVQALQGGTVAVSNQDDPYLAGTTVQIPPAALSMDRVITIAEGKDLTLSDGAVAAGPVADIGPQDATFVHSVTVTLPYSLATGQTESGLVIVGVDASGSSLNVSSRDLVIDKTKHTVSFITRHLIRFGAAWSGPATGVCAVDESFCGCCGSGQCIPKGQACPLLCPANACIVPDAGTGGGTGGGGGGGGSCCPAGESFCGCGDIGQCIPSGQACPLACPVQQDPTTGGTAVPPPSPVCCGPGTYLCGCGGQGQCVPDTQACPLACPVCDPTTLPTPCGCLPPGAVCGCDPNQPSTVPCQCDPTTASNAGASGGGGSSGGPAIIVCAVDAGSPCGQGEYLSACGCIPLGAICAPPPKDGGTVIGCSSASDRTCCDGQCVGAGQACPQFCFSDGGTGAADGGVCPPGTARCASGGACQPAGVPCQGP